MKTEEEMKEQKRIYYENNREKRLAYNKEYNKTYRLNNKAKIDAYNTKHYEEKAEYYKKYMKEYQVRRMASDPLYKLTMNIRSMVRKAIKGVGVKKSTKTASILGCSFKEFKTHIEQQWEPWMNWDNYGLYNGELNHGWDIDHIQPLASAITENEVIALNHHKNLRPLCSYVNRVIKR